MKRLLLLIAFSPIWCWANPTTKVIDSLHTELKRHPIDNEEKILILNQLGYYHWIVDPVKSVFYGNRALTLAEDLDDVSGRAFAHRVIGVGYWAKGEMDKASSNLKTSIELYESLDDELGVANAKMNLGLVFSALQRYERALEFYEQAYELFYQLGAESRIGTTYTKIGTIYLQTNKLDSASLFLEESLRIHQKNNYRYGLGEVYNRLGILDYKMGKNREATSWFHQAIDIGIEISDLEGLTKNYADLSQLYIEQGRLSDAENLLKMGVEISRDIGVNKWLTQMFFELRQVYELDGDLKKSLYYYDLYVQLKDSLINQEIINSLIQFETEINTIEQKNQLAKAESELKMRNLIIGLAICLLVIVVLIAYVIVTQNKTKLKREEEEKRKLGQELAYKNKELTSYALNLAQKNQLFEEIEQELKDVKKSTDSTFTQKISTLEKYVVKHHQVDKDWEDFRLRFESIHEGFFDELLRQNPNLTNYELRLCALIKLNFSMKEIGNILGISADSVKTARYRLKKKLNVEPSENLNEYVAKLLH